MFRALGVRLRSGRGSGADNVFDGVLAGRWARGDGASYAGN